MLIWTKHGALGPPKKDDWLILIICIFVPGANNLILTAAHMIDTHIDIDLRIYIYNIA